MSAVVVVTGAGASFDCRGTGPSVPIGGPRPPLTKDLFSGEYQGVLDAYPLVRQAAVDIRLALQGSAGEEAIALEDFLRERMLKASSPYTQRRFRQVPLYLQHVLAGASNFTRQPENYNALMNAALEKDEALFLTLNYDTLLDQRLAEYWPATDMDWYIGADSRWSLIKLHGSVDWAWRLDLPEEYVAPPRESLESSNDSLESSNAVFDYYAMRSFPQLDNEAIELREATTKLQRGRWDPDSSGRQGVCYPAIAVPLGPADELVCPGRHVEAAQTALREMEGLNLLVVGYSGLDQEVLRLFSESGNSIRQLLVVNGDGEMSRTTAERVADAFGVKEVQPEWIYPDSFSHAVETGALQRWIRDIT